MYFKKTFGRKNFFRSPEIYYFLNYTKHSRSKFTSTQYIPFIIPIHITDVLNILPANSKKIEMSHLFLLLFMIYDIYVNFIFL